MEHTPIRRQKEKKMKNESNMEILPNSLAYFFYCVLALWIFFFFPFFFHFFVSTTISFHSFVFWDRAGTVKFELWNLIVFMIFIVSSDWAAIFLWLFVFWRALASPIMLRSSSSQGRKRIRNLPIVSYHAKYEDTWEEIGNWKMWTTGRSLFCLKTQ